MNDPLASPRLAPLPQELIRAKREGLALSAPSIGNFVEGVTRQTWSEGQVAAMAMAILLKGMSRAETVALTQAMAASGQRLDWAGCGLHGPILDKHSTGGVGDKVSLVLAPLVAACGGVVPMISGRGLGHTGGTLDKLEALPGYGVNPMRTRLNQVLREAGCAIVGASDQLAPADRRLYAIRDVTATVESVPLITASILSKKLAAGLQALTLDVKVGGGAVSPTVGQARELADSLVAVAEGAGLPTVALLTDMDVVLGSTAGNALEVQECLDLLCGRAADPRLLALTLELTACLLVQGGLADTPEAARQQAQSALANGSAAERFARMVRGLGGPTDVLHHAELAEAPVRRPVPASHDATVLGMDTRALGLAVVALGGGRRRPTDRVDPRVGLAHIQPRGARVQRGEPLAWVHAGSQAAAEEAIQTCTAAFTLGEGPAKNPPVVLESRGGRFAFGAA